MRLPTRMAWLNGPVGVGAWSVRMARRSAAMRSGRARRGGATDGPAIGYFQWWAFAVCDQVSFDTRQVFEHRLPGRRGVALLDRQQHARVLIQSGLMDSASATGAAGWLIEDPPVVRQFEEQIAAPLERLHQYRVFAQADQCEVEAHVRLVEGLDIRVAHLAQNGAQIGDFAAVPVLRRQLDCFDLEQLAG